MRGEVVKFPGQRWPASSDPELDPRAFLEALLSDIDAGKYTPAAMIVSFVQPKPDGTVEYPYVAVNLSELEAAGLLAKLMRAVT